MAQHHRHWFYFCLLLRSLCGSPAIVDAFAAASNNPPSSSLNPTLDGTTTKNVATQILQGVGPCSPEDLEKYNIDDDIDRIVSEWTANMVQSVTSSKAPTLQLGCQSDDVLYVDTIRVVFPRVSNGMGIQLQEIAGGREDGLGITVVVDKAAGMLPGDSIANVALLRKRKQNLRQQQQLEDTEEIMSVATECLGYDATVQAIQSLPPLDDDASEEVWQVTVKRIRRKPLVQVELKYPPSSTTKSKTKKEGTVSLQLFAGENLRQALLTRGVTVNDGLARRYDGKGVGSGNCGAGGLCRTCTIAVETGADLLNPPRVAEQTMFADAPRMRLACKAIVGYGMKEGTLRIRMFPNQW